jgi:ferredoxin
MAEAVHGKVVALEQARQLIEIDEDIPLTDLEQVIPYSQARDILVRNPKKIVVMDCPCRAARGRDGCKPLDVCLIVGDPFASRFARAQPHHARWIGAGEAIAILEAEHRRGHVHHAFFKDATLGRFYAICNCCGCCCGPMEYFATGTPMLASSGYAAQVDPQLCDGCGACARFCQFSAIEVPDGRAVVDVARCMGCAVCESRCAPTAIAMARQESRGVPLDIGEYVARGSGTSGLPARVCR